MRLGDRIAMMRAGRIEQIGTAEQILNDPANNYVAQFVQDVDRSRVITADGIMEAPPVVIGPEQGPMTAQKLMRETQTPWLVVVGRDRTLVGMVNEADVAAAVRERRDVLPVIPRDRVATAGPDTLLADMFQGASDANSPVVVIDDNDRVLGTVPHVTLLAAASSTIEDVPADAGSAPVEMGGVH